MALPSLEDWKAPWEVEGADQGIDKDRLKRYLYDLQVDKDRLQGSNARLTTERDALKGQLDEKAREGESEADRLKRELAETQQKLEEAGKTSIETLKLRAALKAGLEEKHVNRLVGTTLEELEADAKELKESFGGSGKTPVEEKDTPRGRPRPTRNPADPDPSGEDDLTVEQMLASAPSRHPF